MKKIFFAALLIALSAAIFAPSAYALDKGDKIKNFTVTDLSGKSVSLDKLRGKVVVLNFWASWCPPCRGEMPEFNELNKEFEKSGKAVMLAVNATDGRRETKSKVESFIKEAGYTMPIYLDSDQSLQKYFNIMYLPTTFIIDRDGKLSAVIQGAATKEAVKALVEEDEK